MLAAGQQPLDAQLFSFDPASNTLAISTSDVPRYLDNLSHDLEVWVYYSDLGRENGESTLFTVELSHVDCSQLQYAQPLIADYQVTVGFPSQPHTWALEDVECGNWVLEDFSGVPASMVDFQVRQLELVGVTDDDEGVYSVEATFAVPKTLLVEVVLFTVTIEKCEPTTLAPVSLPEQTYEVFSKTLTMEFEEFVQTPQCTSYLVYELTDVLSQSGQSIPAASFASLQPDSRLIRVSTNDRQAAGTYQLVVQAYFLIGVLRPETLSISLEIKDPCMLTSFTGRAAGLTSTLAVPEGQTQAVFTFAPLDSFSAGQGRNLCGPMSFELLEPNSGSAFSPESVTMGQDITSAVVTVRSAATGLSVSQSAILSVSLVEYPGVEPLSKELTVVLRVAVEQESGEESSGEPSEESGFEMDIEFPPLEPVEVSCEQETVYGLPVMLDPEGKERAFTVTFLDEVAEEFVIYDDLLSVIFVSHF